MCPPSLPASFTRIDDSFHFAMLDQPAIFEDVVADELRAAVRD